MCTDTDKKRDTVPTASNVLFRKTVATNCVHIACKIRKILSHIISEDRTNSNVIYCNLYVTNYSIILKSKILFKKKKG